MVREYMPTDAELLTYARAATPPSRAAIRSSKTAWVGFMIRV